MKFDISERISAEQSHGRLAVFSEVTPPRAGPPLHLHREQTEIFHVISGRYRFVVDGQSIEAGPGDCLMVEPGQVHGFINLLDTPSRLNFEIQPAMQIGRFFERLVAGDFDASDMAGFFSDYGMDLSGPPLSVEA
jgi:quercetin dioxygenase-like cupin family protein